MLSKNPPPCSDEIWSSLPLAGADFDRELRGSMPTSMASSGSHERQDIDDGRGNDTTQGHFQDRFPEYIQNTLQDDLRLRTFTGIQEQDDHRPDPFCDVGGSDGLGDLGQHLGTPGSQQPATTSAELEATIHRIVGEQSASNRTSRSQVSASQVATFAVSRAAPVDRTLRYSGGYQEVALSAPQHSSYPLEGIQDFAQQDPVLSLRDYTYEGPSTASVNQQRYGEYVPAHDDEDDGDFSEHKATSAPTSARRSSSTVSPRTRGNRKPPPRSDAHPQFLSTDPRVIQEAGHTHTIDRTQNSGRNLMALYDGESVPRTRFRLRIERGRTAQHSAVGYPQAHTEIPARLTLAEICRRYPNHVWGSGLRLFMHEKIPAEQIWRYLPEDFRMKGCKSRPHNYLQAAIGREIDQIMLEETGHKRQPMKRKSPGEEGEEVEKPVIKKQKTTSSQALGNYPQIAPRPAAAPQSMQRSFASPYTSQSETHVAQSPYFPRHYQGRAAAGPQSRSSAPIDMLVPPTGLVSASTTQTTTALPISGQVSTQVAANAMAPARSADDLRRLIQDELSTQEAIARMHIGVLIGPTTSTEEMQRRLRWRQSESDRHLTQLILQRYGLSSSPVGEKPASLMVWILSHHPNPGDVQQAERLISQDIDSRALNWYLHMMKQVTQLRRKKWAQALQRQALV